MRQRCQDWVARHPWIALLVSYAIVVFVLWLLPFRDSLGEVALRCGISYVAFLAITFLRYRSFFPTRERVREEAMKATQIERTVRRGRDHLLER
jgi:hypothetical protein